MGARAEVLEVDTYGGQNGSMLTGVDVASSQPALAYLVGLAGACGRDDLSSSGPCHGVCVHVRGRVAMVLRCVRYARLDRSRFTKWHGLGRGPCLKDGSEPRLRLHGSSRL